jgi:hypothetical protein
MQSTRILVTQFYLLQTTDTCLAFNHTLQLCSGTIIGFGDSVKMGAILHGKLLTSAFHASF